MADAISTTAVAAYANLSVHEVRNAQTVLKPIGRKSHGEFLMSPGQAALIAHVSHFITSTLRMVTLLRFLRDSHAHIDVTSRSLVIPLQDVPNPIPRNYYIKPLTRHIHTTRGVVVLENLSDTEDLIAVSHAFASLRLYHTGDSSHLECFRDVKIQGHTLESDPNIILQIYTDTMFEAMAEALNITTEEG